MAPSTRRLRQLKSRSLFSATKNHIGCAPRRDTRKNGLGSSAAVTRVGTQQARLLALPPELRSMIWKHALIHFEYSNLQHNNQGHLYALRYRPNGAHAERLGRKRIVKQQKTWSVVPTPSESKDWYDDFLSFKDARPVNCHDFFSLALTSKSVSTEVLEIFYGYTHFIFENRLAVHLFLDTVGANGCYLRSISVCLLKSQGPYSEETTGKYEDWKLKNSSQGPSLTVTIERLRDDCPNLEYLELCPRYANQSYPSRDHRYMKNKPYSQWPWVNAIVQLQLRKGFAFCQPTEERQNSILAFNKELMGTGTVEKIESGWKQQREIEAYINAHNV